MGVQVGWLFFELEVGELYELVVIFSAGGRRSIRVGWFYFQLEVGGVYELVLTTRMGLYRYRIGDVVRIVKFRGQCPVYEFMYR